MHNLAYAMDKQAKKIQVNKIWHCCLYVNWWFYFQANTRSSKKGQIQPWALKNQQPMGSGTPIGKTNITSVAGISSNLLKRMARGRVLQLWNTPKIWA